MSYENSANTTRVLSSSDIYFKKTFSMQLASNSNFNT